jgi:hypothetical protein
VFLHLREGFPVLSGFASRVPLWCGSESCTSQELPGSVQQERTYQTRNRENATGIPGTVSSAIIRLMPLRHRYGLLTRNEVSAIGNGLGRS